LQDFARILSSKQALREAAMKGVVFTEFLEFVAATHGDDMVDDIIDDCDLPNGGAYTSVGTYHHTEMQALVSAFARRAGTATPDVLLGFGRHLCRRFADSFPEFFQRRTLLFEFLESVDNHIHVEVRKLYPDADLPSFETHDRSDRGMALDYRSCRPLESLAERLILGASDYFGEPIAVRRTRHESATGGFVRFTIERAARAPRLKPKASTSAAFVSNAALIANGAHAAKPSRCSRRSRGNCFT
jgi:hypothetical protein